MKLVPGAGIDNFAGSKVGRTQCARRVQAMDGLHQPHGHRAGSVRQYSVKKSLRKEVGARGRGRTGTVSPPRDFLTHYNFRCSAVIWHIWGLDFLFTLFFHKNVGRSRQVSTLSLSNEAIQIHGRTVTGCSEKIHILSPGSIASWCRSLWRELCGYA